MPIKNEKSRIKSMGSLFETEKIKEFWETSKELMDDTPLWYKISQIKASGAKKHVSDLIRLFQSADEQDDMPQPKEAKQLGASLKNSFDQGNYLALAAEILTLTLYHIAEAKNISLPDDLNKLEVDKMIIPHLTDTAILPFYLISALTLGKISDKIEEAPDSEQEYFLALLFGIFMELEDILHIEDLIYLTNPRRKKRKVEFIDSNRKVMEAYCELLESQIRQGQLKKQLQKLIEKDPDFYDPYSELADAYIDEKNYHAASDLLEDGFGRALGRIVDSQGDWPESMPWDWLENRHLIRMLDRFAYDLWGQGYEEYALYLYKRLLKSNPNDNIGARYNILAINMGYGPGEVEDEFPADQEGFVDAIKMHDWFTKNASDFSEDLGWWLEWEKQQGN